MHEHVGSFLHQAALEDADRVALCGDASISYGELHRRSVDLARVLMARTSVGDAVGIWVQRNTDFVIAFFGATYAGLRVLPFVRSAPERELVVRLSRIRARLLITDGPAPEGVEAVHLNPESLTSESAEITGFSLRHPAGETALMLFTSGTSGVSKVAQISHRSLVVHTQNLAREVFALGADDVVLGALPLCHSFGLRTTMLASFAARARIATVDRFDATHSLAVAAEHGATFIAGVPTMFAAWAQVPGPQLSGVRWCLSAGAPLAESVRSGAEARLGAEVRQGYGLTEATFTAINAPPDRRASGTCGRPTPEVSVRIQAGEIQVRGPNVMQGYLDDPEATDAAFEDGWLRTGDLGEWDPDGRLIVRDRLKDILIRGGQNVVPSEVEEVLKGAPGVRQAAVVGRDDEVYGDEIVAVLVGHAESLDLREVAQYVADRLGKGSRPREYVVVDALPLGPSRKVLRRVLRTQIADGILEPRRLS